MLTASITLQEHKTQLSEQLQQVTKQLEALQTQQVDLKSRNVTLEKVLDSQQQQVNFLTTGLVSHQFQIYLPGLALP